MGDKETGGFIKLLFERQKEEGTEVLEFGVAGLNLSCHRAFLKLREFTSPGITSLKFLHPSKIWHPTPSQAKADKRHLPECP